MRCKQAECLHVQTLSVSAALSPARVRDRSGSSAVALAVRRASTEPAGHQRALGGAEAAAKELGRGLHAELLHDARAVELHRLDADLELLGDLAAGLAVEDALQDFPLPRRQQLERHA